MQNSTPAGCAATSSVVIFVVLSIAAPPSVSSCPEIVRVASKLSNELTRVVVYEGEGHGFRKPENQLDEYRRMQAFLATHVRGG